MLQNSSYLSIRCSPNVFVKSHFQRAAWIALYSHPVKKDNRKQKIIHHNKCSWPISIVKLGRTSYVLVNDNIIFHLVCRNCLKKPVNGSMLK